MNRLSSKALRALWERANRKDLRGGNARTPTLKLSEETFPDYHDGLSAAERQTFHSDLRAAAASGAIAIDWDRRAGQDGQVVRIRLASLPELTTLLGERTASSSLIDARNALSPLLAAVPAVTLFLDAWAESRAPRGLRVRDWEKVRDAAVVIQDCMAREFAEVSERRASAKLFGDSKRIEVLIPVLDVLSAKSLDAEARPAESVLASMGLVKHPNTLLIAGPGQLLSRKDAATASTHDIQCPYTGASPLHIHGYVGTPAWLLTVENLTIFHELAAGNAGILNGLVIYTGGFPSPAVLRTYLAISNSLRKDVEIYHWGDTDVGGFRIAAILASATDTIGRRLSLWAMGDYRGITTGRPLADKEIADIEKICARNGWAANADAVARWRIAIEQELQPISLPKSTSEAGIEIPKR